MLKEDLKGYKDWLFLYYTENVLVIGVYQVLLATAEITMAILPSIFYRSVSIPLRVKGEPLYGS